MKRLYEVLRSIFFWTISVIHFFPICTFLVILGIVIDPRRNDRPQRWFFRNVVRFAGVRLDVRRSPRFDPTRTSFFVCNHVNIFDPFVIYSAIPQFVRGLELESHFRVPVYGWMMMRFGNIAVPNEGSTTEYKRMIRLARSALDDGISLIVFAEGTRTRDGRVGPFKPGVLRMAQQFGYPVVPMSIVGSFEFNRKGSWMLRPSTICVHIHETIETAGLTRADSTALMDRVHSTISTPLNEWLARRSVPASSSPSLVG